MENSSGRWKRLPRIMTGIVRDLCTFQLLRASLCSVAVLVCAVPVSFAQDETRESRLALHDSSDGGEISIEGEESIRVIVRSFETAAIASEVNARITYLPAREGDAFKKGDVLVEFDCRRATAEHDAAEANMRELKAAYQSQLKLLEYKSTGTVAVEQALRQYEKAQAELRLFAVKLESCRILAPFDGVVTEKVAQMHEIAQPNQPLIKILNQSRVELVMMVPSAWLPRISGATFPVTIDETGRVHSARVLQSTGLIDPVSQTSRVIAELVGPAKDVLPGMSGIADLGERAK
jgi:RND family efflux transporter MFP subunit